MQSRRGSRPADRDAISHTPTILVVDDEHSIRDVFSALLEAKGYRVFVACDGREACQMLTSGTDPDLIITDLVMPNQEGLETIRAIRERYPDVGIIAISGAFGGKFLKMAKGFGADATLIKPIKPDQLWSTVAGVLAGERFS